MGYSYVDIYLFSLLYFVIIIDNKPYYPFLNNLFVFLQNNGLGFLATAFFALFCLYLLWASIKGNLKFGMRMFLINIHPMKKNETYMNSFLFNIMLILLTSVSVTQFCAESFRDYTTMTDIDIIFSTQIKYLKFFSYFFKYKVFEYALFVRLTFIILGCCCSFDNLFTF
jgi:LMBR1 domain-containing protein 1